MRSVHAGRDHTTVARLFRLWLPTVFGASMLVVEIPVVAAAAARSTDGGRALAAIGVGMSLLVVVNTPALAITPLIAIERGRRSVGQLRRYTAVVGVLGTLILAILAVPPGSAAVRALFGLDQATAGAVSAFLAGLAPNSLGVAIRRYQHGRLVHARRTGPIVWATLVRLAVAGVAAWFGTAALPDDGPLVAGAALSAGAFLEAAVLHVFRTGAHKPTEPTAGGWAALIVHHGHLSAGRLLVMIPPVITIIGVAHAAEAADSLIVWPVLVQLVALFTSPTTDWESVAAAALRDDPRNRAPWRLTAGLAAALTGLLAVALATGPADAFVRNLLAVPSAAADLGLGWAWTLIPLPCLWITRAYLRGAVMAADASSWLSAASAAHAVALIGTFVTVARMAVPGVACAGIALVTGVLIETATIGYARYATHEREHRPA